MIKYVALVFSVSYGSAISSKVSKLVDDSNDVFETICESNYNDGCF